MAAIYLVFLTSKVAVILSILYEIIHIIRCKLMGRLCLLLALCSVIEFYKRVFLAFVGFFIMDCASSLKLLMSKYNDFGCGFLVLGCFSKFFNVLALLFMFVLGFKFFQFRGNSNDVRPLKGLKMVCDDGDHGVKKPSFECAKTNEVRAKKGFLNSLKMVCFNDGCGGINGVKNSSFECGTTKVKRVLCKSCGDQILEGNNLVLRSNSRVFNQDDEVEVEDIGNEDEVFDVISLRKMVKAERRKANAAQNELEKERLAASSSVDEAMAMIVRLQNEKSALQIKGNQLERVAEEKQSHDQDVIQSLQWIIMRHESERSLMEDQLRLCREKLRCFIKDEEWEQFDCACPTPSASHSSFGTFDNDVMTGVLDFDSCAM